MTAWDLPWTPLLRRRCRARLEPGHGAYYGRCELVAGHDEWMHALERGMEVVRFQTATDHETRCVSAYG